MRRAATIVAFCTCLMGCGKRGAETIRATIPPHATLRIAAESLASVGVIRSATLFRIYARVRRGDRSIRAGTYALPQDIGWNGVLDALYGGKGLMRGVTIPEGFSASQVERVVVTHLQVPAESVEAVLRDTSWRRRLDIPTPTLEGYLFPDTYFLPAGSTARDAVAMMAHRFEQIWKPEWTARLDTLGLTRHDLVTLASIVETEAKLPEERPVIAAVYLNRLRVGMLLQADPTVQYALPAHKARLMYKDLRVKSEYNTYLHKGLPPGPIASPGRPSLIAALYAADVPYKYFVAFPDGHHEFRVTEGQHEVVVREARRAWAAYYLLHPPDSIAEAPLPRAKVTRVK